MTARRVSKNPLLEKRILGLARRIRVRAIAFGCIQLGAMAPYLYVKFHHPVGAAVAAAIGLISLAWGALTWGTPARDPALQRLMAQPSSAILVEQEALSGGWQRVRVLLDDGQDVAVRASSRDARTLGQLMAGFCPRAELRLADRSRPARHG